MWLIEFVDGHLHGVTLPIEPKLVITGASESDKPDTLCIPETVPANTHWELSNDGTDIVIKGVKKGDKSKKLRQGHVYRLRGVAFFVYLEGNRAPKLMSYSAKKYRAVILFTLILNIGLGVGMFIAFKVNQQTQIAEYFTQLNGSYIKNGKIKVLDSSVLNLLPQAWQVNAEVVDKTNFQALTQLVVEVVSSYSKKTVPIKVIEKSGRDQIQVETFESDNRVMAVFGEKGLSFIKLDNTWIVNNRAKAVFLLKENGLKDVIAHIAARNDSSQVIDSANFPYSIFYSSGAGRYLYDDKYRYWVGSSVPGLGLIQSISRDKAIFKDGDKLRVFFIQP